MPTHATLDETGKLKIEVIPTIAITPELTILTGEGLPPDSFGDNQNLYIDTLTFDMYLKENGTWL